MVKINRKLIPYTKITLNEEFETGRIVGGKKEYGKIITFGALPNNGTQFIDTGIPIAYKARIIYAVAREGFVGGATLPLPYTTPVELSQHIRFNLNAVEAPYHRLHIVTGNDRSSLTDNEVEIWYFKN